MTKDTYKVSITIDEIKPLVLKHINDAQNTESIHFLKLDSSIYTYYHNLLFDYCKFKLKHKYSPTKANKLAFIVLLSYPIDYINNKIYTFNDITLFNKETRGEETDFKYDGYTDDSDFGGPRQDCICSYKDLHYSFKVTNKYSGITLLVGSECITKYKLISKIEMIIMEDDKKKMNRRKKDNKEKEDTKQKEISEHKIDGYYEEYKKLKSPFNNPVDIICNKCNLTFPINEHETFDKYYCKYCVSSIQISEKIEGKINGYTNNKHRHEKIIKNNKYLINTHIITVSCEECKLDFTKFEHQKYMNKCNKCDDKFRYLCDNCLCNSITIKTKQGLNYCKGCCYNLNESLSVICIDCDRIIPIKKDDIWYNICKICKLK